MTEHAFLPSRTGAMFMAEVETDTDGSLAILSNDGHGVRSAHRDYAQAHFGHAVLWRITYQSYVNLEGVRVALTRWHTQAFRKGTAGD